MLQNRVIQAKFHNHKKQENVRFDFSKLDGACVAVTAKGTEYDCVSRVFAPRYGMNEDPVTGSTHCMIAPYWSRRLNKPSITAFQAPTVQVSCTVTVPMIRSLSPVKPYSSQ